MSMEASHRIALRPLAVVLLAHFGVLAAAMTLRQEPLQPPLPVQMIDIVSAEPQPPAPEQAQPVARPPQRERAVAAPPVLATSDVAAPDAPAVAQASPEPVAPPAALPEPVQTALAAAVDPPAPTPARFDADYLDNPRPVYPPLSRREGEQGTVVLRVRVEASGLPSVVDVRTTSGFERLDKVAVATVKRWRFTPGRQGSTAVPTWVDVPITFRLEDALS
jgi:protein TonB